MNPVDILIVNHQNIFDLENVKVENQNRSNGTNNGFSCSFIGYSSFQIYDTTMPAGTIIQLQAKQHNVDEWTVAMEYNSTTLTNGNQELNPTISPKLQHRFEIINSQVGTNIKIAILK